MPMAAVWLLGAQAALPCAVTAPSLPRARLPKAVKRRINALKQLQVRCAHIEAKFYEEVHDLERKYAALYQPLFDKVGPCRRLGPWEWQAGRAWLPSAWLHHDGSQNA